MTSNNEFVGVDEELAKYIELAKAKITVVGVGGAGCNTINRMAEVGIEGATLVGVNTDAHHLAKIKAHKKVLIGKKSLRGLGAGSNPDVGEDAAREDIDDLSAAVADSDMVFITGGLGGGTGTGAAPVIAEIAKEMGALTVGVVTLPFSVEGATRMENALKGFEKLRKNADTIIIIPNDRLLDLSPDIPLNAAFKVCDEVLTNAVKGITEIINKPGLVNVDFADVKTIMTRGGTAMIGLGSSRGESGDRAFEAVEQALASPLLDIDVSGANRALINVTGGPDMSLSEVDKVIETVASKISKSAHIISGAVIDDQMQGKELRVLVVITGGKLKMLEGGKPTVTMDEDDLGIGYVG